MVDDEEQQIMDNMPDPEDREALRDWHLARRLQREDANAAVNQSFVLVPPLPTYMDSAAALASAKPWLRQPVSLIIT